MLLECWERLCGYDKWIETEATVERSDLREIPIRDRFGKVRSFGYKTRDVITWTDRNGEEHRANFEVGMGSTLYLLAEGQSVVIRYNPCRPARFYLRELLCWRMQLAFKFVLAVVVILALMFLKVWDRRN